MGGSMAANFTVVVNGTASHAVPETLFGYMFEDINFSGDGGLYAEMLQNRAFQQVVPGTPSALQAWSAVNGAKISVVNSTSPVSSALPNSLEVTIPSTASGSVGVANSGYFGINVQESWTYNASFFFKFPSGSKFNGKLTASLVGLDGSTLASSSMNVRGASSTKWTEFFVHLKPSKTASNTNNTFTVTVDGKEAAGETISFAMFSLFPPTFKGRANGMRMDVAQALADTKPAFWRFPGGNNLEGQTIGQRWIWNNTVGSLVDRPGRLGDWGYINTDGLGIKEYLDFIVDAGMQPIMAVWAGYSFGGTVDAADIGPFVQEAIDQINFVIGDPSKSKPAALRASLGHPEPYELHYVEIGNEDFFATDTYLAYRWQDFVGNLSAAFPQLNFLATTMTFDPVLTPGPKFYDVHVYNTPSWFVQNAFVYDGFERNGTKYFEGEYAAISTNANDLFGTPADGRFNFPEMQSSTGEAAFMTGLERNSDIVFAASYAPLLQNINNFQWTPNLIGFDAANVYLSTSYYVQKMFSLNKGEEFLPSTLPNADGSVHWSVVRSPSTKQVFIKVANAGTEGASIAFSLPFSVSSTGNMEVLSGAMTESNTPSAPATIVPKTSSFRAGKSFTFDAPAFSVSVLTLQTE